MKPAVGVSAVFLCLVAVAHLARVLFQVEIVVGARVVVPVLVQVAQDVGVALDVGLEHEGAFAAVDEYRCPAHGLEGPYRRVDPAGYVAPCAFKQLFGIAHAGAFSLRSANYRGWRR